MATKTRERPASPPPAGLPEIKHPATGTTNGNGNHAPAVFASIYAPDDTRALWHLAFRCPHCNGWHFGRTRDEAKVTGPRRARCGRLVVVVAARTYRGRG